jgi:hypothetical protein
LSYEPIAARNTKPLRDERFFCAKIFTDANGYMVQVSDTTCLQQGGDDAMKEKCRQPNFLFNLQRK